MYLLFVLGFTGRRVGKWLFLQEPGKASLSLSVVVYKIGRSRARHLAASDFCCEMRPAQPRRRAGCITTRKVLVVRLLARFGSTHSQKSQPFAALVYIKESHI